MRTHEDKNGVTKEAIVLQWAVQNTSWDFKPVKKRWAVALCSVENATVLCKTIVKDTQIWTSQSEEEERNFGHLVTYWFGTFATYFKMLQQPTIHLSVFSVFHDEQHTQWH